jgi:hypothetical protein
VLAVDVEVAASCRSCLITVSVRLGDAYGCVDWLWLSTALSTAPGFVHTACRSPNTLKFEDVGDDAGRLGRALAVLESKAPCISSSRSTPHGQVDRHVSHDQHIRIRPVTLVTNNISCYRRLLNVCHHISWAHLVEIMKSAFHNTTLYIYTLFVSLYHIPIHFLRQYSNNTHTVSAILTTVVHLLTIKLLKCNFRSKPPLAMNMERILLFY